MKKLGAALILGLSITACSGDSDNKQKLAQPLSTASRPLDGFEQKGLSLVEASNVCASVRSFFESYASQFLDNVAVATECSEVVGSVYSAEELAEGVEQIECASDRRCFKALVQVRKGQQTDRYDAFVAKFPDDKASGVIGSLRKGNKHYLPRKGTMVYSGELLDDGLSSLSETFRIWIGG